MSTDNELAEIKRQLAEVHGHVAEACVRMGAEGLAPLDSWTLRETVDAMMTKLTQVRAEKSAAHEITETRINEVRRELRDANAIAIRSTAERDTARKENAALRREAETEREHVRLLRAEVDRAHASRDDLILQLQEQGRELARVRDLVAKMGAGGKVARVLGKLAQMAGLS